MNRFFPLGIRGTLSATCLPRALTLPVSNFLAIVAFGPVLDLLNLGLHGSRNMHIVSTLHWFEAPGHRLILQLLANIHIYFKHLNGIFIICIM